VYRSRLPQVHAPARSIRVKARPVAPAPGAGLFRASSTRKMLVPTPMEETAGDIDVATASKATAADAPCCTPPLTSTTLAPCTQFSWPAASRQLGREPRGASLYAEANHREMTPMAWRPAALEKVSAAARLLHPLRQ
jgi:hypothetical protein